MLQAEAEDIESKMQKCNSLCKSIQSSFEKIVKLKELINKLRIQNIEIDMKELERSTEDWQKNPWKNLQKSTVEEMLLLLFHLYLTPS